MNAASPNTVKLTHNVASEIHRALSESNMSIADLSRQIIESEQFIRRVLTGEDGMGKSVHMGLLQSISDATRRTLYIKVSPNKNVKRGKSVKTQGAKP